MKNILTIILATLCAASAPARAQNIIQNPGNSPSILDQVGIDQKIGDTVSPDLQFFDEHGNTLRIGDLFTNRPIVLVLIYYQCPMLCTMVLNDLLRTMRAMPENIGRNFDVITVSFDPRDTPDLALLKKKTYLAQYNRPGADVGWHFLTGPQSSINAITRAVGFRYVWDPKFQVYAHASGIIVLTPAGKISRYFFGIDYAPKDLRIALASAGNNQTGSLADAVLLYCFCYDPATGKYGLAISRLLKTGGVFTILAIGGFVLTSLRREKFNPTQGP
jgi:protein SCO1